MFLVTFSVIYFNLHFPVIGERGVLFFLNAWGGLLFFSITVSGELPNIEQVVYNCLGVLCKCSCGLNVKK